MPHLLGRLTHQRFAIVLWLDLCTYRKGPLKASGRVSLWAFNLNSWSFPRFESLKIQSAEASHWPNQENSNRNLQTQSLHWDFQPHHYSQLRLKRWPSLTRDGKVGARLQTCEKSATFIDSAQLLLRKINPCRDVAVLQAGERSLFSTYGDWRGEDQGLP